MNPHPPTLFGRALLGLGLRIFALRYRIRVRGLDRIRARGRSGIVFLPNHPALIDPIIVLSLLYKDFAPRSVADEVQVNRPIIGSLARRLGARILPNLDRRGAAGVDWMRRSIAETIAGLQAGENLLVYPAGHLKRNRLEEIGGASAVKEIVDQVPGVRVVLVRQNGLWGSRFSRAFTGEMPQVGVILRHGLLYLVANGLFFMPRRTVDFELVEPDDFPREGDRLAINRYLEAFYNANAAPNTYVPYGFWDRHGVRALSDPEEHHVAGDVSTVPAGTRQAVVDQLASMIGRADVAPEQHLATDLGLDSLATAELVLWLEQEFAAHVGSPELLRTVGDVMLAAAGRLDAGAVVRLKPVGARWFQPRDPARPADVAAGRTVVEALLRQAAQGPGRIAIADQTSGERSYREIITAMMVLAPIIRELPGQHVGLMFPASVGAVIFYLASLAAGKTPVMVNWTTGSRNMAHSLDLLGVRTVLTARALLTRLDAMGVDLEALGDRFLAVEDLRARVTLARKIGALVRSHLSWASLTRTPAPEHAVVLFTSGSESLPKAVPLTHENVLTNIRDVPRIVPIFDADVLIGFLPPFHSFGMVVTMLLPVCGGVRAVYHPNPTESALVAHLVEGYKVNLLVGTPTFLGGIVRASRPGQLASLRLAVTGAEKCPDGLFDLIDSRCPRLKIIEGYGITECSPIVSANRDDRQVRGSIGWLLPSVEGVIVSVETGGRVAPGETGMLLVRGPSIFPGYLNFDGDSPFVEFEGARWYRTGDLVRQREDGALFFEGRLKRFVKLGGEMISLPAIESALVAACPSDADEGPALAVDALGDPDDPEIVLFTTRADLDRAGVNARLREQGFSALYHVRQVIRVEDIPLLGTGKTDYRRLKERYTQRAV